MRKVIILDEKEYDIFEDELSNLKEELDSSAKLFDLLDLHKEENFTLNSDQIEYLVDFYDKLRNSCDKLHEIGDWG